MESPFFDIRDDQLTGLKDQTVLITGGSSGIGLATARLCLDLGAQVVVGDVNECPITSNSLSYQRVDVRDWKSQSALFRKAVEKFGKLDHVFANAGVSGLDNLVTDKVDSHGDLLPPNLTTLDINLTGVIYTCKLGVHYLKKNPDGGSIVITGSASSFAPFALTDYGTSKHAVLGLMRNLEANLTSLTPAIRTNCVTPLWTASGMVPKEAMEKDIGIKSQGADVVAKSVVLLMTDAKRRGQVIYSIRGRYKEMDSILLPAAVGAMETGPDDFPKDAEGAVAMWELVREKRGF